MAGTNNQIKKESGGQLGEIRKTVTINAPIEVVWKAVSTAEGIEKWWMASSFSPEAGKKFALHAGPYGESPCIVTLVEPPNRLEFDWDNDWHITFLLEESGNGTTEFTLVHSGWDAEKVTRFGQTHASVHEVMEEGWENIVRKALPNYAEIADAEN